MTDDIVYGDGNPKPAGTWDFYGSRAPGNYYYGSITFTLGIFQWVAKSGGGTKRAKVTQRVKGYASNPQEAIIRATGIVTQKNWEEAK